VVAWLLVSPQIQGLFRLDEIKPNILVIFIPSNYTLALHHKLTISWNFNRIHAKLVNNMFVQISWVSKCKNGMKK
jgi:hypothetical protein